MSADSLMKVIFDRQAEIFKRIDGIAEAMVIIMREVSDLRAIAQDVGLKTSAMADEQRRAKASMSDVEIMVRNSTMDLEELTGDVRRLSAQVDTLDDAVRNIRIYRMASGELKVTGGHGGE